MKINMENFSKIYPMLLDEEELLEKGLGNKENVNERYIQLLNIYKTLFSRYILSKLPLKKYDEGFQQSELKFIPVTNEDMDFYQSTSCLELMYIYIRNNFNVEHLSPEDIQILLSTDVSQLDNLSQQIIELIERTYKQVINPALGEENVRVTYGPDSERFLTDSESLVLGIRHDEYEMSGLSEVEWDNNNDAQMAYLNSASEVMKTEFSSILGIPVKVIKYDEFTICDNFSYYK